MFLADPSPEMMNRWRAFISLARHSTAFDVSDDMQNFVQEDFVRERAGNQVKTEFN
jgi:hypothetical protein